MIHASCFWMKLHTFTQRATGIITLPVTSNVCFLQINLASYCCFVLWSLTRKWNAPNASLFMILLHGLHDHLPRVFRYCVINDKGHDAVPPTHSFVQDSVSCSRRHYQVPFGEVPQLFGIHLAFKRCARRNRRQRQKNEGVARHCVVVLFCGYLRRGYLFMWCLSRMYLGREYRCFMLGSLRLFFFV